MGDKIDRTNARIDKMASIIDGTKSAAIDAAVPAANLRTALRFAEHEYLLGKARLPISGLGPGISDALKQVPPIAPTVPQFEGWAQDLLDPRRQVASTFSKVDSFVGSMGASMSAVATAFANVERAFETVRVPEFTTGLTELIENLPKLHDFDRFWSGIAPAIDEFQALLKEASEGQAVLEAAEFGFSDHLWDVFLRRAFARVDPRMRKAGLTNMLAARTRKDEFAELLYELVAGSRLLRRRWRVIGPALEMHRARGCYELGQERLMNAENGGLRGTEPTGECASQCGSRPSS